MQRCLILAAFAATAACGAATSPACVGNVPGTRVVLPFNADTVRAPDDRAMLIIPAHALAADCPAAAELRPADESFLPRARGQPVVVAGTGVNASIQYGEPLRKAVTLVLRYPPSVGTTGIAASRLRVAHVKLGECLQQSFKGCVQTAASVFILRPSAVLDAGARELRLTESDTLHGWYAVVITDSLR
jgi:hypothetical protein